MAEATAAASAPPTFKLVLVGDGGTGKVWPLSLWPPFDLCWFFPTATANHVQLIVDDLCQASLDWRVWEEVHCYFRCRGPSSRLHNGTYSPPSDALNLGLRLDRTWDQFNSMSGTRLDKKNLADWEMATTSTGNAASSCLMSLLGSPTKTSLIGIVSDYPVLLDLHSELNGR